MCVQSLNCVWLFVALWTVVHQTPLSMEFCMEKYWSELPFPPSGDLPYLKIKPFLWHLLRWQEDTFTTVTPQSPSNKLCWIIFLSFSSSDEGKCWCYGHWVGTVISSCSLSRLPCLFLACCFVMCRKIFQKILFDLHWIYR